MKLSQALKDVKVPVLWSLRPAVLCHPNIPKPMHGLAPRNILGVNWWNKTRKQAYKSTDYHCIACGVHRDKAKNRQWLEGHELYDISYVTGRMKYIETIPLCHYCHSYIHSGRLQMLLRDGKIHQHKYVAIITHGDSVLAMNNIVKPEPYMGLCAVWQDWRLVLDGKEYPPIYKSYNDWLKAWS
jgi:hypothetical protein